MAFDFGKVKVHTGAEASATARALGARALTLGRDVIFGDGEYAPATAAGRRLLAHELAHVVQQEGVPRTPRLIRREENREGVDTGPPPRPSRGITAARRAAAEALDRTIERVQEAIRLFQGGEPLPEDVAAVLRRFFPRETGEFLPLLLRRFELVRGVIETVRVRRIVRPLDVAIEPLAIEVNAVLELGWPARAFPPHFIALFPPFYREPELQATRLVHEAFHWYFPSFVRHTRNTRGDAFAYQGFVSALGGLEQAVPLRRYPEPGGGATGAREVSPPGPEAQPKLLVGRVDDPLEREADRIAETVMRMPAGEARTSATLLLRPLAQTPRKTVQRAQIGRVHAGSGAVPDHFLYELDSGISTFDQLRRHYGVPIREIERINPGARATALRLGQRIRVPAIDPPARQSRPVGPPVPAIVQSTGTNPVSARWNSSASRA